MRNVTIFLIVLLFIGIGFSFYLSKSGKENSTNIAPITKNNISLNKQNPQDIERVAIVAQNLDTPWGLVFLPDNSILVTERKGDLRLIDSNGNLKETPIKTFTKAKEIGEGGLLGVDIHPDFLSNGYVYFYYTYDGNASNTKNRVVRAKYESGNLGEEEIVVDNIPGASNHNGGRVKFGPDGYLYIGTGDAQEPSLAQNKNSLAGKILRVTDKGNAANGNPFNNQIYSYGHRNVQGLAWDTQGNFWATEHGRSAPTGYDELNYINSGNNYGWPNIQGDETENGMMPPVINSGPTTTWAPAGAAIFETSIYFGGLRGQALYKAAISSNKAMEFEETLKGEFGRIRDVILGPDNMLYITTSNRDGRGNPENMDDKIVRVNPLKL